MLTEFFDHLTVMSPTKTRVLQVEFSSQDPDLAARGANAVADLYIELKTLAKRESAHQAAETLKPQIAELEAQGRPGRREGRGLSPGAGLFDDPRRLDRPLAAA